jgi:hypothetical protein
MRRNYLRAGFAGAAGAVAFYLGLPPVAVWFLVGFFGLGAVAVYRERGPEFRYVAELFLIAAIMFAGDYGVRRGVARRAEAERVRLQHEVRQAEKQQTEKTLLGSWPSVHASLLSTVERAEESVAHRAFGDAMRDVHAANAALSPYVGLPQTTPHAQALVQRLAAVERGAQVYVAAPRYADEATLAAKTPCDDVIEYHRQLGSRRTFVGRSPQCERQRRRWPGDSRRSIATIGYSFAWRIATPDFSSS